MLLANDVNFVKHNNEIGNVVSWSCYGEPVQGFSSQYFAIQSKVKCLNPPNMRQPSNYQLVYTQKLQTRNAVNMLVYLSCENINSSFVPS